MSLSSIRHLGWLGSFLIRYSVKGREELQFGGRVWRIHCSETLVSTGGDSVDNSEAPVYGACSFAAWSNLEDLSDTCTTKRPTHGLPGALNIEKLTSPRCDSMWHSSGWRGVVVCPICCVMCPPSLPGLSPHSP